MFWIVTGILLILAAIVVPSFLDSKYKKVKPIIRVVGISLALIMILGSLLDMCLIEVKPGQIVKVYTIEGTQRTLSPGRNFVLPWDRQVTWNSTVHEATFLEKGDDNDPNDAFGGQTQDGDYMTTVANIGYRIDTERLDDYIKRFGEESIGTTLDNMVKGVLKECFERQLEQHKTEDVLANKSKITGPAAVEAKEILERDYPILVDGLVYPDIVAEKAYEDAIKLKAQTRQEKEQYDLEKDRNDAKAKADKAKADGEAEVVRVNAEAEAMAVQERATGDANAAKTKANADAEVRRINSEAEAAAIERTATANANALLAQTTAEAEGNAKLGKVYLDFPALMNLKELEIQKDIGTRWNGVIYPNFGGSGNGISFTNMTPLLEKVFEMISGGTTTTTPAELSE